MKTRTGSRMALLFLIGWFSFTAAVGQAPDKQSTNGNSVDVQIADQPDSPLQLNVLSIEELSRPKSGGPTHTVRIRISNAAERPIRAWTLAFTGENSSVAATTATALGRPLAPRQSSTIPSTGSGRWTRVVVSVDFVEFTDGTHWGNDSYTTSRNIERFFAGRNLALTRLEEILADHPDAQFHRNQVNAFLGSTVPGAFTRTVASLQLDFDFGYDSVLKGLRVPGPKATSAQELARQLELMQAQTKPN